MKTRRKTIKWGSFSFR